MAAIILSAEGQVSSSASAEIDYGYLLANAKVTSTADATLGVTGSPARTPYPVTAEDRIFAVYKPSKP